MTQVINDDVEIQGNLEVQGSTLTSQLNVEGDSLDDPLQTWKDSAGNLLARMTAEGQLQVGSFVEQTGAFGTGESHIEVYRDEADEGKPTRGMNITGGLADNGSDPLEDPISWVVQELTLKGSEGVKAAHTALRVGLTNENTGMNNDGSELRAGNIETINNGGGNGTGERIQTMIGLRVAVTNVDGGYVTDAYGLKINVVDETSNGISNPCAIQIDSAFELLAPANVPGTPAAGAVRMYARDGHLYTKLSSGNEYQLSIAPTPVSGDETKFLRGDGTWQEAGSGSGTVTSVGLSAPSDLFTVSNSPVTSDGTITLSKSAQNSNLVYASPASGGADVPLFRSLVADDIPNLDTNKITSGVLDNTRVNWAAPGAIGGTTPNSGAFTSLVSQPTPWDRLEFASRELFFYGTGGNQSHLKFRRASGTVISPTVVNSDTILGAVSWDGYDSAEYGWAGEIVAIADENFNTNGHGTRVEFRTAANGSKDVWSRLTIEGNGQIKIRDGLASPNLSFYTFADNTADNHLYQDLTGNIAINRRHSSSTSNQKNVIVTSPAVKTASTSVTTNSSPGTLIGFNVTPSVPDYFLTMGKTLRLRLGGYAQVNTAGAKRLNFVVEFGSQQIFNVKTQLFGSTLTFPFEFIAMITCRSTGASGTVFPWAQFNGDNGEVSLADQLTSAVTINTTSSFDIKVRAYWNETGCSATFTVGTLEWLW